VQLGGVIFSIGPAGERAELSTDADGVTKDDTDGVPAFAGGPNGRVLRRRGL
jgi:hypothetical protein